MVRPTTSSRLLAAVPVALLATGAAGMVVALRRRHPNQRRLRPSGRDAVESPDRPAQPPDHAPGGSGRRRRSVREGTLHGGLPYLAIGEGPPLVVFSGLTVAHANPTGLGRWPALVATACRLSAHGREVQRRFADASRIPPTCW